MPINYSEIDQSLYIDITLLSTPNRIESALSPLKELGFVIMSQVDLASRIDLGSMIQEPALDRPEISMTARKKLANHAITV